MSDLKELFDMVTNKTEPDVDAWREQERRQRKQRNGRRAAAYTAVAVIAIGAIVASVLAQASGGGQPMQSSTPPPVVSPGASLVEIDVATGRRTTVSDDVAAFRPAVSPDGTQVAFERAVEGKTQVFVARIDGSDVQQVTGLKGQPGCGCGAFDPAWSPDGKQLAYSGTNGFGDREIFVITISTGEIRTFTNTNDGAFAVTPSWAPGGGQIAYGGGGWQEEPSGSGQIFTAPVDGKRPPFLLLANRPGAIDPSWDPSGTSIVFTANVKGGTALFTASIDVTHGLRRLTEESDDSSPAWSPDGTRVAFVRGTDIAVLTLATGEVQTLGTGGDPAWSPDGSTIYAWQA